VKGDGNWCRAYALALHGKPVTFLGAYAVVTVIRNEDDSFTADITRPSGETDIRAYARRDEGQVVVTVAAECASIAAHGPDSPLCRSGEHSLCGHVTFATPSAG
jgi:hypothetical protein